jgi:hypothetical protein
VGKLGIQGNDSWWRGLDVELRARVVWTLEFPDFLRIMAGDEGSASLSASSSMVIVFRGGAVQGRREELLRQALWGFS